MSTNIDQTISRVIGKNMTPAELRMRGQASMRWLQGQIKDNLATGVIPPKDSARMVSPQSLQLGRMYAYVYDPKHKKTLPYYDNFPLIFPVEIREDGWDGLNLHYLPPLLRATLFARLLRLRNNRKMDETTKLNLSYQVLSAASNNPYYKPCYKRYLVKHARSRLLLVHPAMWEEVIFLPTESFQKENRQTVWRESKKMVRKR